MHSYSSAASAAITVLPSADHEVGNAVPVEVVSTGDPDSESLSFAASEELELCFSILPRGHHDAPCAERARAILPVGGIDVGRAVAVDIGDYRKKPAELPRSSDGIDNKSL